jgi:hypothetical protein
MVIYGPTHTNFDEDLGVIMVQDCTTSHWLISSSFLADGMQISIDHILAYLKMVNIP